MTNRPPLTIAHIEAHQDLKGARKYPTTLAGAGLSVGELARHALEEAVDLRRYLMLAGVWTLGDEDWFEHLTFRLLPIADHPAPLPPDVPTVEAVAIYGNWWQFGDVVVEVDSGPTGLKFYHPGWRDPEPVDPADPRWLGPVPMRAVRS